MFGIKQTRLSVIGMATLLGMGAPILAAPAAAQAISCHYADRGYSEGSVIVQGDGHKYVCNANGTWSYHSALVVQPDALTIPPGTLVLPPPSPAAPQPRDTTMPGNRTR